MATPPVNPAPRVRHLAASHAGTRIAAAQFERRVAIWDVNTGACLSEFDTGLDFGGRRLAISPAGDCCVAAGYYGRGVACYSAENGKEIWRRRDLKKQQYTAISPDGQRVYACSDHRPCFVLDLASGATLATLRGVRAVYESPYQDLRLLEKAKPELQSGEWQRIAFIILLETGILTAAFGPGTLCISEGRRCVRCFDASSGEQIWLISPEPGCTILEVAYATGRSQFVGVQWPHRSSGPKQLVCFDPSAAVVQPICVIGEPAETTFCAKGDLLLTSDGEIIDTVSSVCVRKLPFWE